MQLSKASIMKVVFVLFVAMAVLEISFALKCKVGESRGKDEFYQDLPCVPGADTCYVAKVTKNDNVIYSASCYEGGAKDYACNKKHSNYKVAGYTFDTADVCCCKGDNCNDLAFAKSC